MAENTRTVKLTAAKHAADWRARYDDEGGTAEVLQQTARSITLELDDAALRDLISDAIYYAAEMGPDNTGDTDYRPAARACLRSLERSGVQWIQDRPAGFSITLL